MSARLSSAYIASGSATISRCFSFKRNKSNNLSLDVFSSICLPFTGLLWLPIFQNCLYGSVFPFLSSAAISYNVSMIYYVIYFIIYCMIYYTTYYIIDYIIYLIICYIIYYIICHIIYYITYCRKCCIRFLNPGTMLRFLLFLYASIILPGTSKKHSDP